jgi:VIT1/CCC1 family predicted Fe2+/Mn2+ transporter
MQDLSDLKQSEQAAARNETEAERLDRNLMELLQELRVASIGVQFLFAFLLVVPFQQGWADVTEFEKRVYYIDLLLTAIAGICLMAPVARHRLRFHDMDKKWIVESSHKYAIAGLVCLALAIGGVIMLISHVVFSGALSAVSTTLVLAGIGWIWFGAPLARQSQDDD